MIHNEMYSNKRKKYRQKGTKCVFPMTNENKLQNTFFIGMETEGDLILYIGRS